jgi:hypothetical protein
LFGRSRESLTLIKNYADILLQQGYSLEQACRLWFMEKVEVAKQSLDRTHYENQSPKATAFSAQASSSNRPRRAECRKSRIRPSWLPSQTYATWCFSQATATATVVTKFNKPSAITPIS